jgi:Domain of unknown function (DUF5658)
LAPRPPGGVRPRERKLPISDPGGLPREGAPGLGRDTRSGARLVKARTDHLVLTTNGGLILGTPEQFRWVLGIIKAIMVLNLLDAVLTLMWVRNGLAVEANSLLRDLVTDHALGFVLAKLALVSLGCLVLWRRRHHPLALAAIFLVFLAYYLVFLYHLQFTSGLLL